MLKVFLLVSFVVASIAAAPAPRHLRPGDPFEGIWSVKVSPSGEDAGKPGAVDIDETITFTPSKMSTKKLGDHGFGPADYQEDLRAFGPAKFTCTQTSDKEGKLEWSGFTTGSDIQGTMVWTKKDGLTIQYDFQGSRP
jgi:hypothetical protein